MQLQLSPAHPDFGKVGFAELEDRVRTRAYQYSPLAPPPPECPPPKFTSGLRVCGSGVIAWGDSSPNALEPAFIQFLSLPDMRAAV